ncbi:epidermal growth factor-like protein 6 isoform X3 [Malaclemys terrapin pileata]|uniref:epidermal growth factor-like protein 6 isoform X3 n=1 Tax=Malaclemys terrapin pileata TaxID=2991368 RepID=UPI0023A90735|nr:epidermal growth factor-like protein 6 isoform X3 [Malaclemys terrapin pileata]
MGPIACSALLATLLPFVTRGFADTASSRGHRQLMSVSQPGVCRYGSKLECCYGWRKNKGHCEATCEHGCKYGECVGPNKCKCFPGFTGKTCSQDTNECGLKPRPCEHRCMNTHGSYKCYCLNGYMLMPDGTCANSRTCAMVNCQYGCEEVKEEVRCLCPSTGLQLGPNGRTCIGQWGPREAVRAKGTANHGQWELRSAEPVDTADIDECSTGKAICSYNRRCVNTFGSYYCKCQIGYELKYVRGHYDCVVIPENLVKEVTRIPGAIKDTIKKLLAHKSSVKKHEEIKNVIPEPAMTPASKVHLPSFDYEDGVYIGGTYDVEEKETEDAVEEEQEEEQEDLENQIGHEQSLRGDVFIPKVKEAAAFGSVLAQRKVPVSKPEQEVDCSFSQGICNWKQDTDDDFDWNPADRDNGDGYYMAVPAFVGHKKNVGRLKLLLTDLKPKRSYCLIFSYRLAGDRVGKLRVFLGSHISAPAWEQSRGKDERWRTGKIEMLQGAETTKNIIFESERGKGKTGEIGVDTVTLVSGLCPKDHLVMDI